MLPQFTDSQPYDINEHFGLNKFDDKDEFEIEFESDPASRPEEFKDFTSHTEENVMNTIPRHLREGPKFTDPKTNLFAA